MRMSWKFVIGFLAALAAILAVMGSIHAQEPSPKELMTEANARYERGEYAEAAQQYEALLSRGYQDPAIYFNLGNAYLESDDLGRAVLNYLRAEELSPRDPSIVSNLALVRSRTIDRVQAEGDSLAASVSDFGRRWATTEEYGLAGLLLWTVFALAICVLILASAARLKALLLGFAAAAFVLMLGSLTLTLSMLYSNPYENSGVVIVGTVDVLDGPGQQFTEVFALHSGAQVRIVDSRHGWLGISLPGGELRGWAPDYAIETITGDGGG